MSAKLSASLNEGLVFIATRLEEEIAGKPVMIHSTRLMFMLWDYGYDDQALFLSALLHDVLEDSAATTYHDLADRFGRKVAEVVQAVSYDKKIPAGNERIDELFSRTIRAGRRACLVKCADTLDNSFYISLCQSHAKELYLKDKMRKFLDISKSRIGNEKIWQDLWAQYENHLARLSLER